MEFQKIESIDNKKSCLECLNYNKCKYKKGDESYECKKYIKNNILLFDGAMGTMLQQRGLKIGENPEVFGFKNPDKLMEIHSLIFRCWLKCNNN